jgi:hypothetical protein
MVEVQKRENLRQKIYKKRLRLVTKETAMSKKYVLGVKALAL